MNGTAKAPLSNKGANAPDEKREKKPRLSVILDWMRYTVKYDAGLTEKDNLELAVPRHASYKMTGEMLPNARGYDHAMKLENGVLHWHSERREEGVGVELPGNALAAGRSAGYSDENLIRCVATIGGLVSTMDAAIDCYDMEANPNDILIAKEGGTLATTARQIGSYVSYKEIDGKLTEAQTVYVGSAKSKRQIKVYNKALEQGKADDDWIRIEMRWRGRHAQSALAAMLIYGIANTTREAVKSMLTIENDWFQRATEGELSIIEPTRRLETDTRTWLINLCLPVLKRCLLEERAEEGTRLYDAFDAVLHDEYNARGVKRVRKWTKR